MTETGRVGLRRINLSDLRLFSEQRSVGAMVAIVFRDHRDGRVRVS
jgi:hypothetical protein